MDWEAWVSVGPGDDRSSRLKYGTCPQRVCYQILNVHVITIIGVVSYVEAAVVEVVAYKIFTIRDICEGMHEGKLICIYGYPA